MDKVNQWLLSTLDQAGLLISHRVPLIQPRAVDEASSLGFTSGLLARFWTQICFLSVKIVRCAVLHTSFHIFSQVCLSVIYLFSDRKKWQQATLSIVVSIINNTMRNDNHVLELVVPKMDHRWRLSDQSEACVSCAWRIIVSLVNTLSRVSAVRDGGGGRLNYALCKQTGVERHHPMNCHYYLIFIISVTSPLSHNICGES